MLVAADTMDALSAAITAIPPTIAAVGALLYARSAKGEAAGANRAVNHKAPDTPTISEQVDEMHGQMSQVLDEQQELRSGVATCAKEIGAVSIKLDRHLAHHRIEDERRDQ